LFNRSVETYKGVEVRFEKENIDTLSGDGELMLTILSSFEQEESKNVSDNINWRFNKILYPRPVKQS